MHTWLARTALNPDGVSYLDLAATASAGQWSSFVQGYWSPLYPALIAALTTVAGHDPVAALATAHAINGIAMIAAVILLWRWSRDARQPFLTRAMIAALLVVSSGLPRIEAVTPDVVLLALAAGIAHELLVHHGRRWLLTGLLLGAAFLTKTSCWPWLALSVPLRLWGAGDGGRRRAVLLSSAVTAALMLAWLVPLSVKTGHATLGSSARLNYCWYIQSCDSRSPDAHAGSHAAYRAVAIEGGGRLEWAELENADRWTYAPWSDPTAWEAGVRSRASITPGTAELAAYWARLAARAFGFWLLPVTLGILLPFGILYGRAGTWRRLVREERGALVVILLGVAGVLQFVAVHAEPRLIAPFGLLAALGVLHALATGPEEPRGGARLRHGLSLLGFACVTAWAIPRLMDGFDASARAGPMLEQIAATRASMVTDGLSQDRIVIIGPGIPAEASMYLSGAHAVAQVLPRSLPALANLPQAQQLVVMRALFGGRARIAWVTGTDGSFRIVVIPER